MEISRERQEEQGKRLDLIDCHEHVKGRADG